MKKTPFFLEIDKMFDIWEETDQLNQEPVNEQI